MALFEEKLGSQATPLRHVSRDKRATSCSAGPVLAAQDPGPAGQRGPAHHPGHLHQLVLLHRRQGKKDGAGRLSPHPPLFSVYHQIIPAPGRNNSCFFLVVFFKFSLPYVLLFTCLAPKSALVFLLTQLIRIVTPLNSEFVSLLISFVLFLFLNQWKFATN